MSSRAQFAWEGMYQVEVVDGGSARDPLTDVMQAGNVATGVVNTAVRSLELGFACQWERVREQTWSGSAYGLRAALADIVPTRDIGAEFGPYMTAGLRALHARWRGGRLRSTWTASRLTDAIVGRQLRRRLRGAEARSCDAVIMIDSLAIMDVPYFVYYDSSWDTHMMASGGAAGVARQRGLSVRSVLRRRDREREVFGQAAGVIAMSRWLARSLVEVSGVAEEKVHVVYPGVSLARERVFGDSSLHIRAPEVVEHRVLVERDRPERRRRLLFVGRQYQPWDFYRKGGDLVVAALASLRREYDPNITLTIAGVERWPLEGEVPDGVKLTGVLSREGVARLYREHDLLVMPSRFEPFGLVFVEALARGLPCVGRYACAMPEIITPGVSGALVQSDSVRELVEAVVRVLEDDQLYESVRRRAAGMVAYFSWTRAAREMLETVVLGAGGGR